MGPSSDLKSESSGGPLSPFFIALTRSPSIRYAIISREANNALVGSRYFIGGDGLRRTPTRAGSSFRTKSPAERLKPAATTPSKIRIRYPQSVTSRKGGQTLPRQQ
ncbi:hypothetical protein EVAR_36775_1 [Eumeta japonica]|uniref:Uncharacterized protein n=1 Tax=Eumeta variegata TaxID=151549 RepID=A0A4C1X478_EUMVA|nr:hypothetical protein EVAR_36775_1 [Eumeta japonica]